MKKFVSDVMSSLVQSRLIPAMIIGIFALFAGGCDECDSAADCKLGQVCRDGECKSPSGLYGTGDTSSDDGTEEPVSTDPSTTTGDTGSDTGDDTDTRSDSEEDTDSISDSGSSSTPVCRDPTEDCPAAASECRSYTCEAERCVATDAEDGSPCTASDDPCIDGTCVAGQCVAVPLSGTACEDDGNPCTSDVCQAGVCAHTPLPNGTACAADNNPCTEDVCYSGACGRPLSGISCEDDTDPCSTAQCETGVCEVTNAADQTPCDDGLWCNGSVDRCISGTCTPRDKAGPCETLEPCRRGVCTEPVAPETQGSCEEVALDGEPCDDGVYCNGAEVCQSGECSSGEAPCGSSSAECELEACDEDAQQCVMQNVADGTPCPTQDGLACNGTEKCEAGSCVDGAPFCPLFTDCTSRECDENAGDPVCSDVPTWAPDGTPCETTNLCDGSGTRACVAGLCADGEIPACLPEEQDGNLCSGYRICVVEDEEAMCLFENDDGTPRDALEVACGETVEVSTANTNNEVSAYEAPACAGDFTGGEVAVGLNLGAGTAYTATLVTTSSSMGDALYMALVTDPCDADGSCLEVSDATISSTSPSEEGTYHFLVVDGLGDNRGIAQLTVTCP